MSAGRLAGRRIVVTRPAGQNEGLAALIRAAGGEPIVFPVLEILDLADTRALVAAVDRLDAYRLAVFISPNAVDKALNVVRARRDWPARGCAPRRSAARAKALARHGVRDVIAPAGRFDNEALLALPALADVRGWRVVVFRGDGGRELLGDTLRARGATVDYVECYRRARPDADVGPLLKRWGRGEIDAVAVSSSEGLRNLYDMLGKLGQAWLRHAALRAARAHRGERARSAASG
ncbi:MAG: uroporphyrinogen-III synthase [Burkholderiales bacterium]